MAAKTAPRTMVARFASACQACGGRITPGTAIVWSRSTGAQHTSCHNATSDGEHVFTPCWAGGRCEDAPACTC